MNDNRRIIAYREYREKEAWGVPALFCNDWTALKILDCARSLEIDKPFEYVYGFPNCEWSGGRISPVKYEGLGQIERYFQAYTHYGVKCYATFNRRKLSKEDLKSSRMWDALKLIDSYNGGVILANIELARMIKDKLPSLLLVSSVILPTCRLVNKDPMECIDFYDELSLYFDQLVPMPEHFRTALLKEYFDAEPKKYVVIANQTCSRNCNMAAMHYDLIERAIDNASDNNSPTVKLCDSSSPELSELVQNDVSFSVAEIQSMTFSGYRYFKLQGRDHTRGLFFDNIANYIFEPTGVVRQIKRRVFSDKTYPGLRYCLP